MFTKRWLLRRFWSLYPHATLEAQLENILGTERTLGDPEFESLLMVVLHNTRTDSPWPLSNNTAAHYNRADRYLSATADRNLDLPLARLVRGSTAAPIYFSPETLRVGAREMVFQDGGITPFNNPAFLLYLMATLPAYNLGWATGADNLLVVSVGTGHSAASHPGLVAKKVNLVFNARNLPAVFMNGASVSQDLLCRAVGACRFGPPIDREFDRVTEPRADEPRFSYVRYDADMSDEALTALGFRSPRIRTRLRKLDAKDHVDELRKVGATAAAHVDVEQHFAGFLPAPGADDRGVRRGRSGVAGIPDA